MDVCILQGCYRQLPVANQNSRLTLLRLHRLATRVVAISKPPNALNLDIFTFESVIRNGSMSPGLLSKI